MEEKVRQNAQLIQLLHQSEIAKDTDGIIAKLKKASVGQYWLEDAEWNVFMKAVDEKFPSFSFTLSDSRRNISELEMKFCYLRKAGFSGPQIRSLIGISRTTAWRWANRYSWISREKKKAHGVNAMGCEVGLSVQKHARKGMRPHKGAAPCAAPAADVGFPSPQEDCTAEHLRYRQLLL
ncbi:MAG: helix-turn-helix domain-containing protein [Prevotella sp.]|nr:helix-turn-helix domain-containing protein [Bacteroidales bacterium]MDY4228235.1 helix-turn-helix domain-containing protein [Prevotella sp.]